MSTINRCIRIATVVFTVCITLNVFSQDIHFSQFYASPLTLNPAMTGNLNGNYRLTAIYRNQYATIPAPYNTFAISGDMSILRNSLGGDHAGVGIMAYNDVAGDGNLSNTSVFVSTAYHKGLDRFKRHNISIGIQGGFTQKSLNFDNLYFASQLTDDGFNTNLPNGEFLVGNQSFSYFDFNLGAMYTGRLVEGVSGYGGVSFHHFGQPKESFLGTDNRLGSRLVLHGGGEIFITNSLSVSPSAIYMQQTGAQELVLGSAVGYHFLNNGQTGKRTSLFAGLWYRIPHEIIFVGGIDFKDLRFGISYDLTVSDLSNANAYQGGFEISLAYIGTLFETRRKAPLMYCPRF